MDATTIFFIEFLDLQLHNDPMFDSLYIIGACHFRLYFFSCRDFVVPPFHLLFDSAAPYIAISLQMAHLAPPVAPSAPASPPQVVPSLSSESDPSEDAASSSSSSTPGDGYAPINQGMTNGFLSSKFI